MPIVGYSRKFGSITAPSVVSVATARIADVAGGTEDVDIGPGGLNLGIAENDMLIVGTACDALVLGGLGENFGGPADSETGFVNVVGPTATGAPGYRVAYRQVGATPDTTITIQGNFSRTQALVFAVLRGVNWAAPLDGTPQHAGGGAADSMPNPGNLVTTVANSRRLIFGFTDDSSVVTSLTAPTGFTGAVTTRSSVGAGNSSSASIMFAYQTTPGAAGTLDPAAFGGTVTCSAGAWAHFAVQGL